LEAELVADDGRLDDGLGRGAEGVAEYALALRFMLDVPLS
jgi:hypothetical protein